MGRVEQHAAPKGGARRELPEIQVISRLNIENKDFHVAQFVNCRPLGPQAGVNVLDFVLVCKQSMQLVCIWSVCCVQIGCTLFANSLFTLLSECLQTVCSMCACINHEQVRMDYIFFVPPFPFFEGTRAEFADATLDDC